AATQARVSGLPASSSQRYGSGTGTPWSVSTRSAARVGGYGSTLQPTIISGYETPSAARSGGPGGRVRDAVRATCPEPRRGASALFHLPTEGGGRGAARESPAADRRRRGGAPGGGRDLLVRKVPAEQPVLLPDRRRDAARDPGGRRPGEEQHALPQPHRRADGAVGRAAARARFGGGAVDRHRACAAEGGVRQGGRRLCRPHGLYDGARRDRADGHARSRQRARPRPRGGPVGPAGIA